MHVLYRVCYAIEAQRYRRWGAMFECSLLSIKPFYLVGKHTRVFKSPTDNTVTIVSRITIKQCSQREREGAQEVIDCLLKRENQSHESN